MNYEEIKKLIDEMGTASIEELNIEFPEGMKISMKKSLNKNHEMPETIIVEKEKVNSQIISLKEETTGNIIKAPMVGTFYASSSPAKPPFVKVGDNVKKGQVVCVIEAMKLMNEIESEYDGEIIEICVKNEEMVEYGMPLFKVK